VNGYENVWKIWCFFDSSRNIVCITRQGGVEKLEPVATISGVYVTGTLSDYTSSCNLLVSRAFSIARQSVTEMLSSPMVFIPTIFVVQAISAPAFLHVYSGLSYRSHIIAIPESNIVLSEVAMGLFPDQAPVLQATSIAARTGRHGKVERKSLYELSQYHSLSSSFQNDTLYPTDEGIIIAAQSQSQPQPRPRPRPRRDSVLSDENRPRNENGYTVDEHGCPILAENSFHCHECGGADADGNCKGVSSTDLHSLLCKVQKILCQL
jgi:hypothetical protein